MEEVKNYYDEKSKSYHEVFDTLYFKVYDAITWKYLEPHVPRDSNALVLDAGGGTGRWAIRMAREATKLAKRYSDVFCGDYSPLPYIKAET